jgi:hypothetical protein
VSDNQSSLLEEIDRLKAVAAKVDRLEQENRQLREELARLRKAPASDTKFPESSSTAQNPPAARPSPLPEEAGFRNGPTSVTPAPPGSDPGEDADWKEAYSRLGRRHTKLMEQYEQLQKQAKKFLLSRDGWERYAESLLHKVQVLEGKLQRSGASGRDSAEVGEAEEGRVEAEEPRPERPANEAPTTQHPAPAVPDPCQNARTLPNDTIEHSVFRPPPIPRARDPALDEETQDGNDGPNELPATPPGETVQTEKPVFIKPEPLSDPPIVVSERAVRKRKDRDDGAGNATPPRRIKLEPSSSPFRIVGEARVFAPHEDVDLDEEDNVIPTPRKQRPSKRQAVEEEQDEEEDEEEEEEEEEADAGIEPDPTRVPRGWAPPSWAMPYDGTTGQRSVLDAAGLSSRAPPTVSREKKKAAALRATVADVAEETPESFYSPVPRQAGKAPQQKTPAQSRLHSLLNQKPLTEMTTPSKLPSNPSLDLDKENQGRSLSDRKPKQPQDALTRPAPAGFSSPAAPTHRQTRERKNANKTRLRDKPLSDLRPEDFKINPANNNGYRYAFDEVVRNRDERAQLAGCIDPQCCGRQWKMMAESELHAGGVAIISRPADVKMMEKYLGSEAYRLEAMTDEERRETWMKAKIQDLANRHGRHRHRFARRPSPPGYWNPDFPSTQEIEQQKREAAEMERRIVEERWREAMRGGRWMFRDE